ncbi:unnamed protein product [Zymoseptoria tritici ST99CH_1A5]|uniref:Glycoside hydrolase family 2 immunoglobulin-like beta-sandwich domain-containing protein n=2 Tax=Zymoseptoria tritici TaxID=1047171 RepID=A0A2H1GI52_ZYMTR|nr:unnamed protein product [Zymoseptoria tritici ST99CH_1E4]SMY25002.1 unnamed protein product [Zymoseptoria tritici ST99CH_1A5]
MAGAIQFPATEDDTYPRRDFKRANLRWESLNGPWDFLFDDEDIGMVQSWQLNALPSHAPSSETKPTAKRTIQVPFVFQCPASGINERGVHQVLWYERRIEDLRSPQDLAHGHRLILRFGAVDYHAKVWLDGSFVGEHRGGHVPFDLDLSEAIQRSPSEAPKRLTVRVFDSAYDLAQPRGKQFWGPQPESIFYTPSSGIWQSVWLESVPAARIVDGSGGTILRSDKIEEGVLDARVCVSGRRVGQSLSIEVESSLGGVVVGSGRKELAREEDFVRLTDLNMRFSQEHVHSLPDGYLQEGAMSDSRRWLNGVGLWSPEHPLLYDIKLRLLDREGQCLDEVHTTTGMRSLNWTTGDGTFRLNNRPYFQALFLDQGYWPETLMTPPSSDALRRDVELAKAMGFNGCRKHQKVEDPMFMYWADRLGFLVWGEMANCYHFSVDAMQRFDQEWMEMVRRDINFPSMVTWTPVNESWGYPDLGGDKRQRDHIRSIYWTTKAYDPTRPINDNCGWEHVITDISSFHDYADGPGMAERCQSLKEIIGRGRSMFIGPIYSKHGIEDEGSRHVHGAPVMCTEFGGVNIAASNDDSRKGNWGYTTAKDAEDLLNRVEGLMMGVVEAGHCCGIVWTQFTDIEQEQNGLYTYDRKEKLPAGQMKQLMNRVQEVYFKNRVGR